VFATYVVVCRGPNCRERGSPRLRKRLAQFLEPESSVGLIGYACFGQCDFGPNLALFPEGTWYGNLAADDAARIAEHVTHGEPLSDTPLSLPAHERTEHLRNIAELVSTLERDRARPRHWWWPF
jgi:(2Fe-2S) ferredoxin